MKYWTIQTKDVLERINSGETFQPDFTESRYLKINANLKRLYDLVLKSFNSVNNMNLPGVTYAFAQSNGKSIYSIENFNEFHTFAKNKQDIIGGFWEKIEKRNSVILELTYNDDFNPIFIDINDFQFLMPPIVSVCGYSKESIKRICGDIQTGQITSSEFPSNVIQAHLPYIKQENIIQTYPVFEFE